MPAIKPLCQLLAVSSNKFSEKENLFIEIELFIRICMKLDDEYKSKQKNYLKIIKSNLNMESMLMEANLVRCVINDILSTEEYTLSGIACYTYTPEEVVYEIAIGLNVNPSATFLRKIVELHRTIRPSLYNEIIKKITSEYLAVV